MKKIRFFLSLLMLFSISVGNVWADYTISFKDTGGEDGTSAKTAIADLISSGSEYVQSIDADKAYQAKSGFGVKLASSKAVGYVNITLKATGENIGQIKAEKIVVNAAYYDASKTMKVTVTYTDNTTREQTLNTLTSSIASYVVTLDSEKTIKGIKIESVTQSKGRVYCHSIQVVAASSGSAEPGVLESIAVGGDLTYKKTYENIDKLDLTGLTVTGSYTVGDPQTISSGISWKVRTSEAADDAVALANYVLTAGQTSLQVQATVGDVSSEWYDITGLTVTAALPKSTLIFTNACSGSGTADDNVSWTVTSDGTESTFDSSKGIHYGTGSSAVRYIKLTTSDINGTIKKIVVNASAASGVSATASVKVNGVAFGGDAQNISSDATDYTFTGSAIGAIEVTITKESSATKALYVKSIVVTYETTPIVTVDHASLTFAAKQNIAVAAQQFTLTGANLSSGLTLAASDGFSVIPTSITAADAMAQGGVEVTVTPATPTATTTPVEGTVTISGGGLSESVEVALSMAVTPTYAVGVAVNENAMGSATINGGTATVYAEYAEDVTLVATANPGYEFVNWTVSTEDIDLGEDAEKANGAVAVIGAAGTITANFQTQACTGLAAPVLDEVTTTYQSATIASNAVTNADGYVLNLKKHVGNVAVVTDEIIVAPTVSFEKTGLEANTQYDYSVMAVGDGTAYCNESNPTLAGSFTTNDYPSVAVTYSENNNSVSVGYKKIMTPFALPDEVTNEISGKTFVGWTTKSDFEDGDESYEETYFAKGANFTIQSYAAVTLYAVYATAGSGDVTISSTPLTSAPEQGAQYVIGANHKTAGIKYFSTYTGTGSDLKWGTMNASTTIYFTLSGTTSALTAYDGSAYLKNRSGGFEMSTTSTTIALQADGAIRGSSEETATRLRYNSDQDNYGLRWYASDKSTGNPAYFYKVEQNVSYSDYVISGSAALPVLDAPTGLTAGTYYEEQTITLAATNDAAIYYSLDGNDPTVDAQHLYSEPFTLSKRDVVTVKAIAVKSGYENSPVATAEYNINLPYDFADFAALEKVNNKEYAVRGIISQIDELYNNSKLIYHISGNGSTEGQIKCFRGLGLNKATFTSADDVNLGDNVTVVGTWSTPYSNLNQDNWMLEYTARVHDSYEIVGGLTSTTFQVGEAFDDAILGNLSVKEVFTNGYEETVAGATFNCGDKTEWLENETSLTVYAKLGDDDLTSKDFGVTVSSATLESFVLKAGYKTEYYVGDEFVKPTVIATLSDNTHPEAEATACTGYNMSAAGNYTVNVAFTYGDITIDEGVTYQITVKAVFDNEDAPHTVAKAIELIEASAYQAKQSSTDYMWVSGKVSGFNGTSNKNYYISDDGTATGQLYVYNGSYFNGVAFTDANKLHVGDEVILKATILNYNGSTAELTNSQVVSQFRAPEFAFADIVAGDEFEAGFSADLAVEPTVNSGDAEFTLTSGNTDVVTIVEGKLHAVAEGDAVITATRAATANENALNYKEKTIPFNVHVIAPRTRYAVTFDADGGTGTDPVIANQLEGATVELPGNPYSKENSAFAAWVVNETVSGDAVTVTDGHFTMPAAAVTIKATWNVVATCAISFKVNGTEVATANAPQTVEYTFTQEGAAVTGFTWVGWSETAQADEATTCPEIITSYTPQAGESSKTLYGIYSRVDDSDPSVGKFVKVTSEPADWSGEYLIVNEDDAKAWKGSSTSDNAAIDVTITNNAIEANETTNAETFTIAAMTGGYSIQGKSGKYISGTSGSNTTNYGTEAALNTIAFSDGNVDITSNTSVLRQNNSTATIFRYYKSASYSSQHTVQLFKKNNAITVYTSSPVEKVTITFDANGGEGGCQNAIINKGSQLTICAEAPTKSHSEFAGWKNGDDVYVAGQAYTFDADITLTAQWDAAATYTVTYVANGANGDVPTEVAQYAGDEFTIAAAGELEKAGYTFAGWEYNNTIYAAGENFTMPAENVVLTAQWKNEALYKMHLLTSTAEMVSGMKVVLAYQDSEDESKNALNADITGTNKYISVSGDNVAFNSEENTVTYGAGVVVLIADKVTNGWTLRKDNTNYLQETSVKNLAWNTKDNATVWTINFDGNNAVIANSTNEENKLQYNSSSPRFLTYASQQKQIMLYGETAVVNADASISDLGNVNGEVIVVEEGMTLTVDEEANPATVIVKNGSTVDMSAQLNANNLIIETKGGQSAQITNVNNLNVSGDIYMDITLCDGDLDADYWYCISAPFNIDAANGFYLVDGTKLTQGVDYILRTYDGQQRANTGKGWNKGVGNTLYAGKAYLIGFNPGQPNILRVKAANSAFAAVTSMTLNAYAAGEDADKNWNAVGNPNYNYVSINQDAHVYDNTSHAFVVYSYNQYTFVVGTPMFIQFAGTLNLGTTDHGQYRAPRMDNKVSACVRISREDAARFDNQLYIRASEEATNGFDYGHDLVTMNETTSNTAALIWTENYGKRLAIEEAPMDEQIDYALGISAPAAGTYTLQQVGDVENAEVYLTYEGQIIWNLSKSAYSLDLGKGANSGYGLRLIIGRNNVVTGLDEMGSDTDNTQKVILNGNLFILRDGKMFNATGSQVK